MAFLKIIFTGVKTADGRILDLDKLSPNYLAMFLTPAVVIGIWQTYKKTNISNILGSALILAALYFTGSRGAIIGIGGAIVFGIYYYLRRRNFKFSNLALIGMIIVFLASGYAVFKPDWSDHARKSTSSNIRYYIWQTSLEIISKNPIAGVGLSNYQNYFTNLTIDRVNYPEYISPVALSAHDIYLELFATCGIFGLLTFLYLVFRSGFLKKDHVASLALVAILAYGLVDTPFFRNDLAIMFWIILAIVYNGDKSAKTSKAIS